MACWPCSLCDFFDLAAALWPLWDPVCAAVVDVDLCAGAVLVSVGVAANAGAKPRKPENSITRPALVESTPNSLHQQIVGIVPLSVTQSAGPNASKTGMRAIRRFGKSRSQWLPFRDAIRKPRPEMSRILLQRTADIVDPVVRTA